MARRGPRRGRAPCLRPRPPLLPVHRDHPGGTEPRRTGLLRTARHHAAPRRPRHRRRHRHPHGDHAQGRRVALRRAGAGHRLVRLRPTGPQPGRARLLRLPHRGGRPRHPGGGARRPHRGRRRRRAARPGGGRRPALARPGDQRGRGRAPADARSGGHRRRRRPGPHRRGDGRPRAHRRGDHRGVDRCGRAGARPVPVGRHRRPGRHHRLLRRRTAPRRTRQGGRPRRRGPRRHRDRHPVPHLRAGGLRARRVRQGRRRQRLRAGRARLPDGGSPGGHPDRQGRQLHRRRHLHQAQAAGRGRRLLRRPLRPGRRRLGALGRLRFGCLQEAGARPGRAADGRHPGR